MCPSVEWILIGSGVLTSCADAVFRSTLKKLRPRLDEKNLPLLIFVNKGIETSTNALTLEIIVDTCGRDIARCATFIVSPHLTHIIISEPRHISITIPPLIHVNPDAVRSFVRKRK